MSSKHIFKIGVRTIGRTAGILLAGLIITGCNKELVQPDPADAVIDKAATDFNPEAFTMYYGVTVIPPGGGTVDSVTAKLYLRPAADDTTATDSLLESVSLRDDGSGGDIVPADHVFSLSKSAPFTRGTVAEALVIYRALINGVEYTLRDSLPVDLPVLSDIVLQFDKVTNEIFCSARFSSPTDSPFPDTIWAEFSSATGAVADSAAPGTLLAARELFDNQTEGDSLAGDGIYSRLFASPFAEPITGTMKVLFVVYANGEIYTVVDTLKMANLRPVIDNVTMDVTLTRPAAGLYLIDWIFVDVSDGDGLADLQSVTFQILKPDSTLASGNGGATVFHMLDDGVDTRNAGGIFNDVAAGDGRFSTGVTFSSGHALGTYQFWFVATDYSNETSDTAKVNVVLQ